MSYVQFKKDCLNGLNRKISSRESAIQISPEDFSQLVKYYFSGLPSRGNYTFNYKEFDQHKLLFMLRSHYRLWVEVMDYQMKIFEHFPQEFILTKTVARSNHHYVPKTFKEGTVMYLSRDNYSTCNWNNGIPLWDNLEEVLENGLRPSSQINYGYIKVNHNSL